VWVEYPVVPGAISALADGNVVPGVVYERADLIYVGVNAAATGWIAKENGVTAKVGISPEANVVVGAAMERCC